MGQGRPAECGEERGAGQEGSGCLEVDSRPSCPIASEGADRV